MNLMTHRTARIALAAAFAVGLPLVAPPRARAEGAGDLEVRRSPVVKAVERARPGIVSIRTNQIVHARRYYGWFSDEYEDVEREQEAALGSGIVFHPDGYAITNAHVIERASKIFVQLLQGTPEETEREARVVAVDLDNDLALLRLMPTASGAGGPYRYLPLGRSNDLMIGETVIAVGNPFGVGTTVTTGVISALRRSIKPRGAKEEREFKDFIQIDAAINPGNSGGPVLDVTGRWIGVNTAILNRAIGAEGIGFAIPADRVRDMVARLFKRRLVTGEWLGFDLEAGVAGEPIVSAVYPDGPARDVGLRRGDRLLAVNGVPVDSLYAARLAEIAAPARTSLRLRLARPGSDDLDASVPLAPVPTATLSRSRFGFEAQDAEPTLTSGVVVKDVVAGGPSAQIGLKEGDVVVALGNTPIRNTDDLLLFLEHVQHGDAVDIRVRRVIATQFGKEVATPHGTLTAN